MLTATRLASLAPRLRKVTVGGARGQSLVELALVLPILLLIVLGAIDFGRLYLGYVNAQNLARIAANYAANHATLLAASDTAALAEYRLLVANDARQINCELPDPIPGPVFASGTDLGDPVAVGVPCRFIVLTPMISAVLGSDVLLAASATFPVKQGAVSDINNGTPAVPPPNTNFLATPLSGFAPLNVNFFDISENQPTSWVWDFGDGSTALTKNVTHEFADPGPYTVSLTTSNAGGSDTTVRVAYVEVLEPPEADPIAEFSADVQVGPRPLVVQFTDDSTGNPTSWDWDFGDGTTHSTQQNPSHTYGTAWAYDVTLTVISADGTSKQTKRSFILVSQFPCVVPNFAGTRANVAQSAWSAAGFSTTVQFQKNGNFTIQYQSLPGGLANPPNGCDATIVVGP